MLPLLYQAWRNKQRVDSPALKRIRGTVRVAGWLGVVSVVAGFALAGSAHANVKSGSMAFGREIQQLVDNNESLDTVHLKMNGQSIYLKQNFQPKSVHEVLVEYEKFCKDNPSSYGSMWGSGPNGPPVASLPGQPIPVELPAGMESGVLKDEGTKEGMLICFTKGANSASTMSEALAKFDQSQDLGDVGKLRYVYVKNRKTGTSSKVVTVWTEDSFKIGELALEGDREAPGTDTQLPRPEGARRVLNAEVVGTPYNVRVYEVKQSREEVAMFYDKWAKGNDFRGIAPDVDPSQQVRAYFRGGSQVMVGAFTTNGKNYASISEVWPQNGHAAEKAVE